MAGSNAFYPDGRERHRQVQNKYESRIVKSPIVSAEISVTATPPGGGAVEAVEIPAGAYVTKVAVLCTGAVASADFDVGDGSNTDRFIDGVTTMAANEMVVAPNVATGVDVTAGETGAHYYASADTIDVLVNATATSGSIKVLVDYFLAS